MQMTSVNSSDIASVGYENGTLHIQFRSVGLYEYLNVPEGVYLGLLLAPSHGKYFHACIKNRYLYRKLS